MPHSTPKPPSQGEDGAAAPQPDARPSSQQPTPEVPAQAGDSSPGSGAHDRSSRDICDVYTRSAYLFVTDAFRIGKVKFLLGSNMEDAKVTAYASAEDLRPLVYDLFARGGLPKHVYGAERRHEFYGGTRRFGAPISRILRIEDDPSRRLPIVISIENGEGEVTDTGGFRPVDRAAMNRVAIFLSRHQARVLAGALYGRYAAADLKGYLEGETGK